MRYFGTRHVLVAVQVLLYAVEDFEFADFLHLALFHTSNRFAQSPLGISPRSWDRQEPAEPILLTPMHRFLPDSYNAARDHVSRRERRKSRVVLPVKPDSPVEEIELKQATSPQMEKWLHMLQKGGELSTWLHCCFLYSCQQADHSPWHYDWQASHVLLVLCHVMICWLMHTSGSLPKLYHKPVHCLQTN